MSCKTNQIEYTEYGLTYLRYTIVVTQGKSTAAGKVKLQLTTDNNQTIDQKTGNIYWKDMPKGTYRVRSADGSLYATSAAAYYNETASVEIDQSYLGQTLYFSFDGYGEGSISGGTLTENIKKSYSLKITAGAGVASLTVKDEDGSTLAAGSVVYEGESVTWAAAYAEGYTGEESGTATITAAAEVAVDGTLKTFKLIVTVGEHAAVSVTVTRSGETETLVSGDTITYGESLSVAMSADSGYSLSTQSIRTAGESAESPVSVVGDVVVIAACTAMSTAHIGGNIALNKIYAGGSWGDYRAMMANAAGEWEAYS